MRRILACIPVLALVLAGVTGCKASGTVDCPGAPTTAPTAATSGTCTWTYTPDPPTTTVPTTTTTTTVPPTTTTTTVPPTTTSSTPPPNAFPTTATTGAPNTVAFAAKPGGTVVNTPNAVIDGWHVTGTLLVNAPGVTVKNSWIEGYLDNEATALGSARMTVTDTTIGNPNRCDPQPGLGEHDYTATRVRIIGQGDGFRVSGSNVSISDSYVQTCNDPNNHDDGVQIYCPAPDLPQPCQNIVVNHNTLSNALTGNFTAPLFGGQQPGGNNGQLANSKFTSNLLYGGVYSIYLYGTGLTITGNRIATNPWRSPGDGNTYNGWVYGASDVTCSTVTWSDNRAVTIDGNWQPNNAGAALNCA